MMSNEWTDLVPQTGFNQFNTVPVSISLRKAGEKRARCYVSLSPAMVAKIGAEGCKVKVRLGYGENAGGLQIIADGNGPFHLKAIGNETASPATKPRRFELMLPTTDAFLDCRIKSAPAKHRLEPVGAMKALIIDLPRMFRRAD